MSIVRDAALANDTQATILGILAIRKQQKQRHTTPDMILGYVQDQLAAFWNVTRSQIYREAETMTSRGLITATGGVGRRNGTGYDITAEGRAALAAWLAGTGSVLIRDSGALREHITEHSNVRPAKRAKATTTVAEQPAKRGRPRKAAATTVVDEPAKPAKRGRKAAAATVAEEPVPAKRGRPRKAAAAADEPAPAKRGRKATPKPTRGPAKVATETTKPPKRGRPRKTAAEALAELESPPASPEPAPLFQEPEDTVAEPTPTVPAQRSAAAGSRPKRRSGPIISDAAVARAMEAAGS